MGEKNGSITIQKTQENAYHQPRQAFFTSNFVAAVTVLRVGLILGSAFSYNMMPRWFHSPALESLIIRPTNTLMHAKEGYAIQFLSKRHRFQEAYRGSHFHMPPLVYVVVKPLITSFDQCWTDIVWSMLLLLVDLFVAYELERIGLYLLRKSDNVESLQRKMPATIRPSRAHIFGIYNITTPESSPSKESQHQSPSNDNSENVTQEQPLISMTEAPRLAAFVYYGNPVSILAAGMFRSFQNVWCLFLLLAVREAFPAGSVSASAFFLAVITHVDIFSVVYVIPVAVLISKFKRETKPQTPAVLIGFFILWSGCLQGLSFRLTGDAWWHVIKSTHGHVLGWQDLSPNLGMQWYLCMQTFQRFRRYFVIMVNGLAYLFVVPLTARLHSFPMVLVASFWFVGTLFRPDPTLYDVGFGLCLMLLSPRTLSRMGMISFVACCALPVPVILFVLDYWLWLGTGSGNANYLFFQCLAYNVFVGILLLDFCSSSLKRDKAIRLMQKLH